MRTYATSEPFAVGLEFQPGKASTAIRYRVTRILHADGAGAYVEAEKLSGRYAGNLVLFLLVRPPAQNTESAAGSTCPNPKSGCILESQRESDPTTGDTPMTTPDPTGPDLTREFVKVVTETAIHIADQGDRPAIDMLLADVRARNVKKIMGRADGKVDLDDAAWKQLARDVSFQAACITAEYDEFD